jgi:hypothetical protein
VGSVKGVCLVAACCLLIPFGLLRGYEMWALLRELRSIRLLRLWVWVCFCLF